jgi:hypothetical protein
MLIVTNGCVSIMKDLPLYYIECNCDEWLYEYYEGSTVGLYWVLIVTNGCVSIMKDLPLQYTWMLIVMNGYVSIKRDLLLYCIEH